jgi:hypothetical protein
MNKKPELDYVEWMLVGLGLMGLLACIAVFIPWDGYVLMLAAMVAVPLFAVWLIVFVVLPLAFLLLRYAKQRAPYAFEEAEGQIQRDWGVRDRYKAALVEAVLVEASGTPREGRQVSISPYHQAGKPKENPEWLAIHSVQVSGFDCAEREQQLAVLLAKQWHERQAVSAELQPLRCYWLGSRVAWQAFAKQMTQVRPTLQLPEQPDPWQGIDSLYSIIDQLQGAPVGTRILCAGCHSSPRHSGNGHPEKDEALLWLFGPEGKLFFSLDEWLVSASENLPSGAVQLPQLSTDHLPAQICVSLADCYLPRLFDRGWHNRARMNDAKVETLEDLPDMVSTTRAAWEVVRHGTPCAGSTRKSRGRPPVLGFIRPKLSKPDFSVGP